MRRVFNTQNGIFILLCEEYGNSLNQAVPVVQAYILNAVYGAGII